jgi:hypothetical protein
VKKFRLPRNLRSPNLKIECHHVDGTSSFITVPRMDTIELDESIRTLTVTELWPAQERRMNLTQQVKVEVA